MDGWRRLHAWLREYGECRDFLRDRVEAEMKKLQGEARKFVADGMQNNKLAQEGERMVEEAERELGGKDSE